MCTSGPEHFQQVSPVSPVLKPLTVNLYPDRNLQKAPDALFISRNPDKTLQMRDQNIKSPIPHKHLNFMNILRGPWRKWHLQQQDSCILYRQIFDKLCLTDSVKKSYFTSRQNLRYIRKTLLMNSFLQTVIRVFSSVQKGIYPVMGCIEMRCRDHIVNPLAAHLPQHCQ